MHKVLYGGGGLSRSRGPTHKPFVYYFDRKGSPFLYLALINRAGGLYGRILTEVGSTDQTQ